MRSRDIAKILAVSYPVDVWLEDKDWATMETIRKAIDEHPSGDTLFDFIVKEIGKERNKEVIIRLLQRAIEDLEVLIVGIQNEVKK